MSGHSAPAEGLLPGAARCRGADAVARAARTGSLDARPLVAPADLPELGEVVVGGAPWTAETTVDLAFPGQSAPGRRGGR